MERVGAGEGVGKGDAKEEEMEMERGKQSSDSREEYAMIARRREGGGGGWKGDPPKRPMPEDTDVMDPMQSGPHPTLSRMDCWYGWMMV